MLPWILGLVPTRPHPSSRGMTIQFHVAFLTLSNIKAFDLRALPEVSLGVWYQLWYNCRVISLLGGQKASTTSLGDQRSQRWGPTECWCTICLRHVLVHMMDDMRWCTGSKWLGKIEDTQFTYSSFALPSITRQSEQWARAKCTGMCWIYVPDLPFCHAA